MSVISVCRNYILQSSLFLNIPSSLQSTLCHRFATSTMFLSWIASCRFSGPAGHFTLRGWISMTSGKGIVRFSSGQDSLSTWRLALTTLKFSRVEGRKEGGGGKEGTGRPAHNHQLPRASRSQHWARHTLHLTSPAPYILEMTSGDLWVS